MEFKIIKNYQEYLQLIEEKPINIIQLYADWCKPCSRISVEMELDNSWTNGKYDEINWIKIKVEDIDEVQSLEELKEIFEYEKIPTFYFIYNKTIKTKIETSDYKKFSNFMKVNIEKIYFNYDKLILENNEDF